MSARDHDHISELLAPYVLGALELDEVELVELHLERCPECRELVEEERRVVRALPYLAEPQPVPLHARDRLLQRIQDESAPANVSRIKRLLLPTGRAGWITATTAAAIAAFFAISSVQMQNEMEVRDGDRSEIVEVIKADRGWTTRLVSDRPDAGGGIIVDPTTNAAIMVVEGLDPPESGHSYVVWMINGDQYTNVGNLVVDDEGRGQLRITTPGALANYDGLTITEEPDDRGIAAPLGDEVMAARFD